MSTETTRPECILIFTKIEPTKEHLNWIIDYAEKNLIDVVNIIPAMDLAKIKISNYNIAHRVAIELIKKASFRNFAIFGIVPKEVKEVFEEFERATRAPTEHYDKDEEDIIVIKLFEPEGKDSWKLVKTYTIY